MNKTPKKTRIPSPARSQSAIFTPRRDSSRRSVGSTSRRSTGYVRLSSLRLSSNFENDVILSDNTDISRREKDGSWWKLVGMSPMSQEMLEGRKRHAFDDIMVEIPPHEAENVTKPRSVQNLNLESTSEGSGDNVSLISSLNMKQKKLFNKRETVQKNNMFKNVMRLQYSDENSVKNGTEISDEEKTMKFRKKNFFMRTTETREFPIELINDNTNDEAPNDVRKRNLFSKKVNKKTHSFEQFILTSSDSEQQQLLQEPGAKNGMDTDVQKSLRDLREDLEHRKSRSFFRPSEGEGMRRPSSPTYSVVSETTEFDNWNMLPSSTMIENMDGINVSDKGTPTTKSMQRKSRDFRKSIPFGSLVKDLGGAEEYIQTPEVDALPLKDNSTSSTPKTVFSNKNTVVANSDHQSSDNSKTTQNERQSRALNKNMEKLALKESKTRQEASAVELISVQLNRENDLQEEHRILYNSRNTSQYLQSSEEKSDAVEYDLHKSIEEQRMERLSKNISSQIQNKMSEANNVMAENLIVSLDNHLAKQSKATKEFSNPQERIDITENVFEGKTPETHTEKNSIRRSSRSTNSSNRSLSNQNSHVDLSAKSNLSRKDRSLRKRKYSLSPSPVDEKEKGSPNSYSLRKSLRLSNQKQTSLTGNDGEPTVTVSLQRNSVDNESVLSSENENTADEFVTSANVKDSTIKEVTIRYSHTVETQAKKNPESVKEIAQSAKRFKISNPENIATDSSLLDVAENLTKKQHNTSSGSRFMDNIRTAFRSTDSNRSKEESESEETEHRDRLIGSRSSYQKDFTEKQRAPEIENSKKQSTLSLSKNKEDSSSQPEKQPKKPLGRRSMNKKRIVSKSTDLNQGKQDSENEKTEHRDQSISSHSLVMNSDAQSEKQRLSSKITDYTNDKRETMSESNIVITGNKVALKKGRPRKNIKQNRRALNRDISQKETTSVMSKELENENSRLSISSHFSYEKDSSEKHGKLIETAPLIDNAQHQSTMRNKSLLPKNNEDLFSQVSQPKKSLDKKRIVFRSTDINRSKEDGKNEETEHTDSLSGTHSSYRQDYSVMNSGAQSESRRSSSQITDHTNEQRETISERNIAISGNKMAEKKGKPTKNKKQIGIGLDRDISQKETSVLMSKESENENSSQNRSLMNDVQSELHRTSSDEPLSQVTRSQGRKLVKFLSDEPIPLTQRETRPLTPHEQPREKTAQEKLLYEMKEKFLARNQKMKEAVLNSLKKDKYTENPNKSIFKSLMAPKKRPTTIKVKSAYQMIVDGEAYRTPKMFKPKPWVNKRLYKFLTPKLEPKYKLKSRVRAEKFVKMLSDTYTQVLGRDKKKASQLVKQLAQEMARLRLVQTYFDFYNFCHNYLPREFGLVAVPDLVNMLPLPSRGVFATILDLNQAL